MLRCAPDAVFAKRSQMEWRHNRQSGTGVPPVQSIIETRQARCLSCFSRLVFTGRFPLLAMEVSHKR